MNLTTHDRTAPAYPFWERFCIVFALIVQQGAFVSLPVILARTTTVGMQAVESPLNSLGVGACLAIMGVLCLLHFRGVLSIALRNPIPLLFMCLVLISALWSIHPDVSARRGVGYVLTIMVALYLSARFDFATMLRLLSVSFVISAISSAVFVVAFPSYGIMQVAELAGDWRGVFAHKNQLGAVMAVAVFVELCYLVACSGRQLWRFGLVLLFLALVVLSNSRSSLLMSLGYTAGIGLYVIWRMNKLVGIACITVSLFFSVCVLAFFLVDTDFAFNLLGKDPTLTGRTTLWAFVFDLIGQRPILGWGYRSMWDPSDPMSVRIDQAVGYIVPHSHNAFLEIALQLGWVGVTLMVLMICALLRRGIRSQANGSNLVGWSATVFALVAIFSANVEAMLGQNQDIQWVVFNALLFCCGIPRRVRHASGLFMEDRTRRDTAPSVRAARFSG
jgi:O-antigen ligase